MTFGGTFWSGLVWAPLINAAVALAAGFPTLRTNRHAFVISTLAFALLVDSDPPDWVGLTRGRSAFPPARRRRPSGYHLRHHGASFTDRLGLRGGDAWLPLCAVHRASAAPGRLKQTSRWSGPRASRRCPTSSPPSRSSADHRRGGRRLHVQSADHRSAVPRLLLHADLPDHRDHRRRAAASGAWSSPALPLSALPEVLRFSADFRIIIYGVILGAPCSSMPSGVAGWLRGARPPPRMREALR